MKAILLDSDFMIRVRQVNINPLEKGMSFSLSHEPQDGVVISQTIREGTRLLYWGVDAESGVLSSISDISLDAVMDELAARLQEWQTIKDEVVPESPPYTTAQERKIEMLNLYPFFAEFMDDIITITSATVAGL